MLLAEGIFVMCGNANCEPDDDIILESTQIIPQIDEECLELVIDESATIMDCPEAQENWDDLELNSAAYVASYLILIVLPYLISIKLVMKELQSSRI
ncbi:hypothetical protein AVEN_102578-1 [Araneus ventricosus]|uniref:Uncharacterized protein n=1 Tax=Araneus ventricosus TaxID=182803 RepID=A0A4Y2BID5_ARAVE|nr:hypothetical protein AVEN_102578-1 [Araneus ventricosus]